MKANMMNTTTIEGILYQHNLILKETGENSKNPGTQYITGTIDIATDDEMLNIVSVHYTYVTRMTSKNKVNNTFVILNDIIDGNIGTYMKDGDKAAKIQIRSAIGLNEFYVDRNGEKELVSAKRNEGGFINIVNKLSDESSRNSFRVDMIINKVVRKEANPDKNLAEKVDVSGYIFDFRKALLPVTFSATHPNAMNYFEDLDASSKNPVFTQVWGKQISEIGVRKIVTESAFSEDLVQEIPTVRKDFLITGASREPYIWDDESSITAEEFANALKDREMTVAALSKNYDDYHNRTNNVFADANSKTEFKF